MSMLSLVAIKQYPNYTCINLFPRNRENECFIDINKTNVEKYVLGEYRAERVKT